MQPATQLAPGETIHPDLGLVRKYDPAYLESQPTDRLNFLSMVFLIALPVLSIPTAIFYISNYGFTRADFALFFSLWALSGLSITAGYHRYYAHRTHQAAGIVQWFYLLFGAMTVQNSVLNWASDHRYHHQFEDTEADPYNINKGFFWAHFGWMLWEGKNHRPYANAKDLLKDPRVRFQHRYYALIMTAMSFGLPTLIGALYGRPFAGFLFGGVIRMFAFHHCTFLVNSAAHYFGKPTHNPNATAKNSTLVALFSFSEGYHSFHHAFPTDHRIGYRWHEYDPGKWFFRILKPFGLIWDLKRNPNAPQ